MLNSQAIMRLEQIMSANNANIGSSTAAQYLKTKARSLSAPVAVLAQGRLRQEDQFTVILSSLEQLRPGQRELVSASGMNPWFQ